MTPKETTLPQEILDWSERTDKKIHFFGQKHYEKWRRTIRISFLCLLLSPLLLMPLIQGSQSLLPFELPKNSITPLFFAPVALWVLWLFFVARKRLVEPLLSIRPIRTEQLIRHVALTVAPQMHQVTEVVPFDPLTLTSEHGLRKRFQSMLDESDRSAFLVTSEPLVSDPSQKAYSKHEHSCQWVCFSEKDQAPSLKEKESFGSFPGNLGEDLYALALGSCQLPSSDQPVLHLGPNTALVSLKHLPNLLFFYQYQGRRIQKRLYHRPV